MATVEELEREVATLKNSLTQCVLSIARVRQENGRVVLAGMGVSGAVFGLAGYLLGSRNGMRRARELMK
jgi:D-arabinose 5-phosphate isomerase GutQ